MNWKINIINIKKVLDFIRSKLYFQNKKEQSVKNIPHLNTFLILICGVLATLLIITTTHEPAPSINQLQYDSTITMVMKRLDKLQAGISRDVTRNQQIEGIEKYIASINPKVSYDKRYNYATFIVNEAEKYPDVSASLVTSMMKQESYFVATATSTADARGLMGVMEEIGRWICKELGVYYTKDILYNPEMSVRVGTWFINYLLKKYNSETLAVAHYNGGNKGRSAYLNDKKFKGSSELDRDINEVNKEIVALEDSLSNAGVNKGYFSDNKQYAYLLKVKSALSFKTETRNYIPEVLERRKTIDRFLKNAHLSEQIVGDSLVISYLH